MPYCTSRSRWLSWSIAFLIRQMSAVRVLSVVTFFWHSNCTIASWSALWAWRPAVHGSCKLGTTTMAGTKWCKPFHNLALHPLYLWRGPRPPKYHWWSTPGLIQEWYCIFYTEFDTDTADTDTDTAPILEILRKPRTLWFYDQFIPKKVISVCC